MALVDWDDDGDREGRWLLPLADGRVLLLWGLAHDPRGIHCSVSGAGGKTWAGSRTVVLLPETACIGRYCPRPAAVSDTRAVRLTPGRAADSPRAVQLDSGRVGIVFMNKEGVHYLQAALAELV